MEKFKAAFATDDGNKFMSRHFGDAEYYFIYEIENKNAEFVKKIDNTTEEDENIHADPQKARGIAGLLLQEDVSVVVSKVFGPNIKRIKQKFVCVLVKDEYISDGVQRICDNVKMIYDEWEKGTERKHLNLQK